MIAHCRKIVAARKRAGLSQEALAERLGVARQTPCKIESPGYRPSEELLRRVCDVLGLTLEVVVTVRFKKK